MARIVNAFKHSVYGERRLVVIGREGRDILQADGV
jgi:hypothetical protein